MRIKTESDSIRNPKSAISTALDRSIAAGLMIAVVFTTLALGTVEAWSVAIFELIVLVLVLLWAVKAIVDKHVELRIPSATLPLGAFVLLGVVQSIALTGSDGRTSSLSMDVEATRGAATVIFFLFLCFLITSNFFTSPERLRTLANFLIIFGLALAVFALVQHFTWEGRLFWLRASKTATGLGGPFVNRNHFAGYMEMLIPIPIALALSRAAGSEARLFFGFAAAIMGIAHVSSLSRGGMVSLAAGVLFLAAMHVTRKRDDPEARKRSSFISPVPVMLLMLAAIAVGVFWVGAEFDVIKRIADVPLTTSATSDRKAIWADTLRMFTANPILGAGLGSYETVYPLYGRGDGSVLIQFAHNDYLQVLAEGGLVGGAIGIWFIAVSLRSFAIGFKSRNELLRTLSLGSAAGIFAILVHSLFDFNLQIPSNALLFLVLSAVVSRIAATVSTVETQHSVRARAENPAAAAG
ncbi:MAG: O-antigen ligase family protein [Blastocatellia bacterium]